MPNTLNMTDNPFISIVIPAFNEEKYLSESLESLKKQTYPSDNFEVIVVDNNSTDKTSEVAESFGVRVVPCLTPGVSIARDTGSRAAKGEIIVGTDADTIVSENWLEKIAEHFQKDSELIGLTGGTYFSHTNFVLAGVAYIFFELFQRFNFAIGKPAFSGFNFAVRKEAYERVGGINIKLKSAEDVDLSIRMAKIGKIKFFSDVLVHTSARRLQKNPVNFFVHNIKNYILMMRGKEPEHFDPIR